MTTLTCKIPAKLNAKLEALSRVRRISKSAILREALEDKTKRAARAATPSAFEVAKHLCGKVRGPRDLSTNPKYLKDLGE